MYTRALGDLLPTSLRTRAVAELLMKLATEAGVADGKSERYSAAAPETWGEAMLVPDNVRDVPSSQAETIDVPGAKMSTQLPKLEKEDRLSEPSLLATVMAVGADAGDMVHALLLLFPADTTTTSPPCVICATASLRTWMKLPPRDMLMTPVPLRVGRV